jgi:hypothetical protein
MTRKPKSVATVYSAMTLDLEHSHSWIFRRTILRLAAVDPGDGSQMGHRWVMNIRRS